MSWQNRSAIKVYWMCGRKRPFLNRAEAYAAVRNSAKAGIAGLKPYHCPNCNLWHNAKVCHA